MPSRESNKYKKDDDDENRYQLTLYAENLPNVRWIGRSNPYAKVKITTMTTTGSPKGKFLGRTETIMRDLNPVWIRIMFVNFTKEQVTELEVTIWDDRKQLPHKYIGEARFEATRVFESPGRMEWQPIGQAANSRLYCHIEKSRKGPARGHLRLHLRGLDIKNVEPGLFGLGRSDPFFEVAKKDADYATGQVQWNTVYRSEHINNNLNPYWKPAMIGLEELCYGVLDWPLRISVLDHEPNGQHKLIGQFETTIPDLQSRKAFRGNADREQAILLSVEEKLKTYGLLCVLKADVLEDNIT